VTLERAFAAGDSGESCAEGSEVLARLFPKLMDAFAEPGPDFTDAARTLRSIQEAGWGAWPVMYARTWPNVLVASRERLQELSLTALGSTCIRLKDGRLEIDTVTAAR
jgi:hypothetical protein